MNVTNSGSSQTAFRGTVRKYGAATFAHIVNHMLIASVLSNLIYAGVALFQDSSLMDPGTDGGYLVYMLTNEICMYGAVIAFYLILFREDPEDKENAPETAGYKRFFGETPMLFISGWLFASAGALLTGYISDFLGSVFSAPPVKVAFSGSMPKNGFMFAVFVVCTCLIAPVCEELIYRKILLDPLRKYSDSAAAVITALIFSLSHFNFDQFLYTFLFGYFLGVIAIRSRSVIPCIICHIINNLIAGIETYLPETLGNETADSIFGSIFSFIESARSYLLFIAVPVAIAAIILRLPLLHDNEGSTLGKRLSVFFSDIVFPVSVAGILFVTTLFLYLGR